MNLHLDFQRVLFEEPLGVRKQENNNLLQVPKKNPQVPD